MGCFAAGHVCYLRIFAPRGAFAGPRTAVRARCAAYAVVCAVMVALLWPGLRRRDAGAGRRYSLLLRAMAAGAYGLGPLTAAGGALFLLSDSLIATGLADWPQLPGHDLWIMATYLLGQALLAIGVLAGGRRVSPSCSRHRGPGRARSGPDAQRRQPRPARPASVRRGGRGAGGAARGHRGGQRARCRTGGGRGGGARLAGRRRASGRWDRARRVLAAARGRRQPADDGRVALPNEPAAPRCRPRPPTARKR